MKVKKKRNYFVLIFPEMVSVVEEMGEMGEMGGGMGGGIRLEG